jgi:asparagine synthase (glutamine-hydrolysing)
MCGIAGVLRLHPQIPLSPYLPQFTKMPDQFVHRGPDHLGTWHNDDVFLAHARLKIVDLSEQANQPLFNEDGAIALLFNGEIYNFKTLRSQLIQNGHRFRSEGDGEVIVHLYEEHGESFARHLDGMFALSLWDQKQKKLILARDRTGKKPLFFVSSSSFFFFASEIKAFFPIPQIQIEKNEEVFPLYFVHGNIPTPQTFYKNIHQLEPAHLLICEAGVIPPALKKIEYWDLKTYFRTKARIQKTEAIETIRHLLKNAVSKRLIADVPIGAFLSGGIDSTIITAIASDELQKPLRTFSIGFEGDPQYDESPYARIASQRFQTEHQEFHLTPRMVPELFDTILWHYDAPFADSSAIPTSVVSLLTRRRVTVALTGDGGDENFAGYQRFVASVWMEKIPPFFWKTLKTVCPKPSSSTFTAHRNWFSRISRALEAANLPLESRILRWLSYFYTDLGNLLNPAFYSSAGDALRAPFSNENLKNFTPLSKLLYLNFKGYLADDLNVKMDRASMMHSLETRAPFLDHHLIEYCASLPDSFKIRGFQTKYILKEAYKDILPIEILKRRKAGFGVPLGKWFRGPLKPFLLDKLNNIEESAGYINPHYVRELLAAHFRGEDHSMKLWNILMFHAWNTSDPKRTQNFR